MKKMYLLLAAMFSLSLSAQTTINPSDYFSAKTENPSFTTKDGEFTISAAKGDASNVPVFNLGYNGADNDIRVYAGGLLTITSKTKKMKAIQFQMSSKGLEQWADVTPSGGQVTVNVANAVTTWTGDTSYVHFNVGASNAHGTSTKTAGQFDFKQLVIYSEGDGDIPEIKADTIVVMPDTVVIDPEYFEEYGDITIGLYDMTKGILLGFDILPASAENFAGTYTPANEKLDLNYSYVVIYDYEADDDTELSVTDGKVTITDNNGTITLVGELLASDGNLYTVNYTGSYGVYEEDPYSYEPDDVVTINENFATFEIDSNYIDYGTLDYYFNGEKGFAYLEFNTTTLPADNDMPLPVGTYKIDDSGSANTFSASAGYNSAYEADVPSFYGVYTDDGESYEDTYYFVDGTVTVTKKDGVYTIVVNATSFKGSTFTGTYTYEYDEPSAVESIENNTVNNGKVYNVLGVEVDKNHRGAILIQNGKKFMLR